MNASGAIHSQSPAAAESLFSSFVTRAREYRPLSEKLAESASHSALRTVADISFRISLTSQSIAAIVNDELTRDC